MNNNSYLVTDAVTDEKLTGRFKLIRHGEKKTDFEREKDSWNHERMGTPRVTC